MIQLEKQIAEKKNYKINVELELEDDKKKCENLEKKIEELEKKVLDDKKKTKHLWGELCKLKQEKNELLAVQKKL